MAEDRYVIGIDFGSTQSAVAIMKIGSREAPELIKFNGQDTVQTEMLLRTDDDGEPEVVAWGNDTKWEAKDGNEFVSNFKRWLGVSAEEISEDDPDAKMKKNAEKYTLLFLRKLAEKVSEKEEGKGGVLSPERYVTSIAYPATWSDDRRDLLKRLVEEAGFPAGKDGIRHIKEPIAAMESLRVSKTRKLIFSNDSQHYMVVDFGGGTLDTCIIKTDIQKKPEVVKNSSQGDPNLGGADFDMVIKKLYGQHSGVDLEKRYPSGTPPERKLLASCRENKERSSDSFSKGDRTALLDFRKDGGIGPFPKDKSEFAERVSEKKWKGLYSPFIERVYDCIDNTVKKSGLSVEKIKRVILTGGSSRLFFMEDLVKQIFGISDDKIFKSDSAYTDVAVGCAVEIGRTSEPDPLDGVYLRFCLDPNFRKAPNEWAWRGFEEILKPGREEPTTEPRVFDDLPKIEGTKYFASREIAFEFREAKRTGDLKNTPAEKKNIAVVSVFARNNLPFLRRTKNAWCALKGKSTSPVNDEYSVSLEVKEEKLGKPDYTCVVRNADGAEILREELLLGHLSYSAWFGFGGTRPKLEIAEKKPSEKKENEKNN